MGSYKGLSRALLKSANQHLSVKTCWHCCRCCSLSSLAFTPRSSSCTTVTELLKKKKKVKHKGILIIRNAGISSQRAPAEPQLQEMRNGPFRCLEMVMYPSCLQRCPPAGDAGCWQQVSAVSAAEDALRADLGAGRSFPALLLHGGPQISRKSLRNAGCFELSVG